MDWSGVDYLWIIMMFLSAVWTLILTAPIHCRGSIGEHVMECYISPNLFWWRNKLIYILDSLTFPANVHFVWTFPLNNGQMNCMRFINLTCGYLYLWQVFVDNFVHGDLHPGNILVQCGRGEGPQDRATLTDMCDTVVVSMRQTPPPLQLVLLDAGIVTQLSEADQRNFRAVFTAVVLKQVKYILYGDFGPLVDISECQYFSGKFQVNRNVRDLFVEISISVILVLFPFRPSKT